MAKHFRNPALLTLSLCALTAGPVHADTIEQTLTMKNHAFVPQQISVPANQRVKLTIVNQDDTAAEFESMELNREKVVPAKGQTVVYLDPLDAGSYPFFDDFHRDTTTGTVIAK